MEGNNKERIIDTQVNVLEVQKDQIPEHVSSEMAQLILQMSNFLQNNDHVGMIKLRRQIRRRLFRIRDALIKGEAPDPIHDSGLRAWFELQFGNGRLKWYKKSIDPEDPKRKEFINGGFTFDWDVSSKEPLKLVEILEWDGGFDRELYQKCNVKKCVPPAFTNQG